MNIKGIVFQPRVLQLNLDNINRLPHSKYPDRKNQGICWRGNWTHDLLRARQMPKPLDHQLPRIYSSETDVFKFYISILMNNKAFSTLFCNPQKSFHTSLGSSNLNNRACQSFFKLNNGIYREIYGKL